MPRLPQRWLRLLRSLPKTMLLRAGWLFWRAPRQGRNPRSGASVAVPEKRVPHFKPGKALREAVDSQQPSEDRLA